jgi:hypothetical protein
MRFFFLILLFYTPGLALTQRQASGIGFFKVGKTTLKEMPTLIDTNAGTFYYDSSRNQYYSNEYEISAILFSRLKLDFFQDTLYSIDFKSSPEIIDAFRVKYGEPKKSIVSKTIKCRTSIKHADEKFPIHEFEEKSQTELYTYPSLKGVSVVHKHEYNYNNECKLVESEDFYIISSRFVVKYLKSEIKKEKDILKRQDAEKLKELNNL